MSTDGKTGPIAASVKRDISDFLELDEQRPCKSTDAAGTFWAQEFSFFFAHNWAVHCDERIKGRAA